MKLRSILATALAAVVALSSCSKEEKGANTPNDGPQARMSVSFNLPLEAMTRTQNANNDESAVKTISVYVFDNGIAASAGGYTNFEDVANQFSITDNNYVLKPANNIKTVSGTMKVYVAINLPSPQAYATETALLAAYADVSALSNKTKGFTMLSAGKDVTLQVYDATDASTIGKAIINIDRVVSKIVATATAASYKTTWSNGVELTYAIKDYNVYNEATNSFLVKQATTKSTLNDFSTSYAKGNKTVEVGTFGRGDAALIALTNNYYIGENKTDGSEYGNTTYAFVSTTVTTNKVAKWNGTTKAIDWVTADYSTIKDVYVVAHEGTNYITNIKADATEIGSELNTIKANSASVYTYKGGYVHFMVHLNKNGANDYSIGRNEFIHLNVTGIKTLDGLFPGYPGDKNDPEKPIDPTDETDPENPDPKDPTDPIDGEQAMLNVDITVNPWKYRANNTVLQ